MDLPNLREHIGAAWRDSILEQLCAYVRIPNKSPLFDPDWERHGHMEAAAELLAHWCRSQPIAGMRVQLHRLAHRTPVLVIDIPGELPGCVLLYGHMDKQPEFTGWHSDLGPWQPVLRAGRLYGRGAADDGYAVFSAVTAIAALKAQRVRLSRCLVLIEACEESGSVDLPAHLDALGETLAAPSLVICLDAECGNYTQLWCTTSLRGNLVGELTIRVLTEGVHSGMASGIAPNPFRIAQALLARLEDPRDGTLRPETLAVTIPADRLAQMRIAAAVLGEAVAGKLPWAEGVRPVSDDPAELLLNSTWKAALAVTGADGLPPSLSAGNVLVPALTLKLSLRLPPTCDPQRAARSIQELLERDPPYGAQVHFNPGTPSAGWNAPAFAPWLAQALESASQQIFGRSAVHVGSGGTIPFMAMLGQRFPNAQFFITGVLGPQSNAHGPNEFLHLEYAAQLTACVALVLAEHGRTVGG
jgi:acetylornithine deacetylase/succinyl-diaminopimelate desuccinylase-like protein